MKEFDVVGIGNPLVDILVKVDDSHVAELNLNKGEFNLVDKDRLNEIMGIVNKHDPQIAPGDSTANALAGIANLGGKVIYIGKVGKDDDAAFYEKTLKEGKIVSKMVTADDATGKVIVLVTADGQRTFAVHLGASLKLHSNDIFEDDIKKSKILHLTGYQLDSPLLKETALHAMDIAKRHGTKISIDLADPGVVTRNLKEIREVVKIYADIVFANEAEAEAFSGRKAEEALVNIGNYADLVCVKIGEHGSLIKDHDKVMRIAGVKAKVVDTTGAGDMYAAGILYGVTHGMALEKAGKIASYAAAKVVEQLGARLKHSIIDEVKNL
jgi:sugar/nucleoside kinase (ribokinase family)